MPRSVMRDRGMWTGAVALAVALVAVAPASACYVTAKCGTDYVNWYDWVPRYQAYTVAFKGYEYNFGDLEITNREWDYGDGTGWHTVGSDGVGSCAYSSYGAKTATYRVTTGDNDPYPDQQFFEDSCSVTVFYITSSDTLWWFDGEDPGNYSIQVSWTANGSSTGTFYWDVTAGTAKVNFENDQDTITKSNSNTVGIKSTAASAPSGSDVTIQFRHQGSTGPIFTVYSGNTTVRAPDHLVHLPASDFDEAWFDGYCSHVYYRIENQLNETLPAVLDVNEDWTTAHISDSANENWAWGDRMGWAVDPASWSDDIGVHDGQGRTPPWQNPQDPLGATKVDHWGQAWYVGTQTISQGTHVQTNTHQRYTDHARHE